MLSQCNGDQSQLGSHIIKYWRPYALAFAENLNSSKVKDWGTQIHTIPYHIAEKYLDVLHSLGV